MRILVTALFIIGILMVVSGMYEQRIREIADAKKIEYRFIPRSMYEEQMDSTQVSSKVRNMFDASPLMTGGRGLTAR